MQFLDKLIKLIAENVVRLLQEYLPNYGEAVDVSASDYNDKGDKGFFIRVGGEGTVFVVYFADDSNTPVQLDGVVGDLPHRLKTVKNNGSNTATNIVALYNR